MKSIHYIFLFLVLCSSSCNKKNNEYPKINSKSQFRNINLDSNSGNNYLVNDSILFNDKVKLYNAIDTNHIALQVNIFDEISNQKRELILLIGKYISGKFISFEDKWCESLDDLRNTESFEILKKNRDFISYQKCCEINKYHIRGVTYESFSCATPAVGIASVLEKKKDYFNSPNYQGYQGSTNNKPVKNTFEYFIALSKPVKQNNYKNFNLIDLDNISKVKIKEKSMSAFTDSVGIKQINDSDLQISSHYLSNKNDTILISVFHKDNDSLCISSIQVFSKQKNIFTKLLEVNNINEIDSWGSGYSFFDIIDIDGDGTNELIFELSGYESTAFEIYKYINNRFENVLNVVPWGC